MDTLPPIRSTEARAVRRAESAGTPEAAAYLLGQACLRGWPHAAAAAVDLGTDANGPVLLDDPAEWDDDEEPPFRYPPLEVMTLHGDSPGRAAVCRVLIARGLDRGRSPMPGGAGPLLTAELLDAGWPVDGGGPDDRPLHDAIAARTKQDTASLLLDRGADIEARDTDGATPLIVAAASGRATTARRLVELGADTTAVDAAGRSALRHAAEAATPLALGAIPTDMRAARTVARLLADRAPAQPEDALLALFVRDDADTLKRLIDRGLGPNETLAGAVGVGVADDRDEHLRVLFGVEKGVGFEGLLERLVAGGSDRRLLDERAGGSSLLTWAVALAAKRCVTTLLAAGADPDAADGLGGTPRLVAEKGGRMLAGVAKLLSPRAKLPEASTDSPAARLGVDGADLRAALERSTTVTIGRETSVPLPNLDVVFSPEAFLQHIAAEFDAHPSPNRTGSAAELARRSCTATALDLLPLALLAGDAERAGQAADLLLHLTGWCLSDRVAEINDEEGWETPYSDHAGAVIRVLMAGSLRGRDERAISLVLDHRPPRPPLPRADRMFDPPNHAAYLTLCLLADQPFAADYVRAVAAGRSKPAKLQLAVAEAVAAGDAAAAGLALGKLLADHRAYDKKRDWGGIEHTLCLEAWSLRYAATRRGLVVTTRERDAGLLPETHGAMPVRDDRFSSGADMMARGL